MAELSQMLSSMANDISPLLPIFKIRAEFILLLYVQADKRLMTFNRRHYRGWRPFPWYGKMPCWDSGKRVQPHTYVLTAEYRKGHATANRYLLLTATGFLWSCHEFSLWRQTCSEISRDFQSAEWIRFAEFNHTETNSDRSKTISIMLDETGRDHSGPHRKVGI